MKLAFGIMFPFNSKLIPCPVPMFRIAPVKLKLALVTDVPAVNGLLILTTGARHSSNLMLTVLLSVPHAFVTVTTISLFPFDKFRFALTSPFTKLKFGTLVPFKDKLIC